MKQPLRVVAQVCLLLSLVLSAQAQQTAADFFESGINKSKSGDYTGALQAFNMAITMNPENAPSYYNRGVAKAILQDHRGAILDYDRAIELNGKDARWRI